jgi:phenylacetyl-CoA:acceptor oxidoreductase subunit 2
VVASLLALSGALGRSAFAYVAPIAGGAIAIGLFFVFLEIGRKLRALNVLFKPGTSWMTREVYVVVVLYPLLALAWWRPTAAAVAALGLAGAAFLYCQARILHAAKGIPAWRAPLVPALLCATGVSEGSGLLAALAVVAPGIAVTPALMIVMAASALAMVGLWTAYVKSARDNRLSPLAIDVLAALTPVYLVGQGLALALLAFAAFLPSRIALAAAGAVLVACGVGLKMILILRASHQQGFVLPKVPQRGAGTRAAPHRLHGLTTR